MNVHYQFYQYLLEYAEKNPSANTLIQAIGSGYGTLLEALHTNGCGILLEGADEYRKPKQHLGSSGFGYTVNPNKTTNRYNIQQERQSAKPGYGFRVPTITQPVAADKGVSGRQAKIDKLKANLKANYDRYIAWATRNGKPTKTFKEYLPEEIQKINEYRYNKWRNDFPENSAPRPYTVADIFPELASSETTQSVGNDGRFHVGDTVIVSSGKNQYKGGEIIEYSGCICKIKTLDGTEIEEKDTNLRNSSKSELISYANGGKQDNDCAYKPGDKVRITYGVFSDFVGIVTNCTDSDVTVQIEIFGRNAEPTLKLNEVEPYDDTLPEPTNSFADKVMHKVEILDGQLAGFTGTVEDEDGDYYVLNVQIAGNTRTFKLPKSSVKDI